MGTRRNGPAAPVFADPFLAQFEQLLIWRRDVRRFKPDPLPSDVMERLLKLADKAPSVGNCQPWRFVQVESANRRTQIIANFETANRDALAQYSGEKAHCYAHLKLAGLQEAPVHLAVFCVNEPSQGHGLGRRTMNETVSYSVVCSIHTLWLAARVMGIGVGWVSILDPVRATDELGVPKDWKLIAYLCLGYPVEEHSDPELERLSWQERTSLSQRVFRR